MILSKYEQTTYTISEFGLIGKDKSVCGYNKFLSSQVCLDAYSELEAFAKTEAGRDVLQFSGNGEYLQAKSYIGTIQTISGYTLEILPKTNNEGCEKHKDEIVKSKHIFMNLLHLLYKLPSYKNINDANFERLKDIPIFEIFITMFLDEVEQLIRKGIKSDYLEQEDNLLYLKGKLLINEQIKRNTVHKERFYVQYDEYSQNRAENRLIKKTLEVLLKLSTTYDNLRRIRQYTEHMQWIQPSLNVDKDFRMVKAGRGMEHYTYALIWSKVFLKKESFSSFSGDTIAFAILYPMEKLFECFVEWWLSKKYRQLNIETQYGSKDFVQKLFTVRPDFVMKKRGDICCLADAKWKLIDSKKNYSQSDFYQLFTYKYIFGNIGCLRLYYPTTEYLKEPIKYYFFEDSGEIEIIPLDISDIIKDRP